MFPGMIRKEFSGNLYIHILLVLCLGLLVYANTFHVPFFLSDGYIKENPIVRDIHFPLEQLKQSNMDYYMLAMNRYIPYLTFAFNYRLHGFDEFGYHIINITFHLLNGLLVYALVAILFRTPVLRTSVLQPARHLLAFSVSLLFVLHPIQTETVNWIWHGRNNVLAGFFYLSALAAYLNSRLEEQRAWRRNVLYAAALISAATAMKCKETAITLPAMIALCEFAFFDGEIRKRIIRYIPVGMTLLIIPFTYLVIMDFSFSDSTKGFVPETSQPVQRWHYMLTQTSVLTDYLRLFLFPLHMPVFRPWTLSTSFIDGPELLSGAFLAVMAGSGLYLFFTFRRRRTELSIIGFGTVWFFLAHAVESGFIPLAVLTALYRNYLPSVGLFLAAASIAYLCCLRMSIRHDRIFASGLIAVILVLSALTYQRNEIWKTPLSLAQDVVANAPESAQAHFILGRAYKIVGRPEDAEREFETAFRLDEALNAGRVLSGMSSGTEGADRQNGQMHGDGFVNFDTAVAHYRNRQFDDSLRELQTVLQRDPNHAGAYYYRAVIYHERGMLEDAERDYRHAIRLEEKFVEARSDFAALLAQQGKFQEAIAEVEKVLRTRPDYAPAHRFLGMIYQDTGRLAEAEAALMAAVTHKPDYAEALNNLGEVRVQMGKKREAADSFREAVRLRPDFALPKQNLERITAELNREK